MKYEGTIAHRNLKKKKTLNKSKWTCLQLSLFMTGQLKFLGDFKICTREGSGFFGFTLGFPCNCSSGDEMNLGPHPISKSSHFENP